MPYKNEHAARIEMPSKYKEGSFRRINITEGVSAIIGVKKGETKTSQQSLRFDKKKFSVKQAKDWLKEKGIKYLLFEEAIEEEARVSKKIKVALENKVKDHNEEVKDLEVEWNPRATLSKLEKVFDRGVGAYNTNPQSVRPSVKSPEQWALARVNSFLYALKKGKFRSGKHDTDLLPLNHPVRKELDEKSLRQIDLTPTKAMIENAKQGLELRKEFKRGGTSVGVGTANAIINKKLTLDRVKRIFSYHSRHQVDKEGEGYNKGEKGYPSAGFIAIQLWGGDEGFKWSERKINEIKKEEKMQVNKRHIKEVIEDDDNITIIYGKSEEWEGMKKEVMGEEEQEIKQECQEGFYYDEEKKQCVKIETYNNKEKDFERRIFNIKAETRADEKAGKKYIEGHAALFNEETWIGDFREYIKPNAFRDVLSNDVRVLFNHDPNQILARTKNNTAQIKQDSKGLHYRFEVPNTTLGNDLYELVNSGIINQSSFGFIIEDEKWNRDEKGAVREITKVGRLFDVSPVSFPAYEQTNDLAVAKRKYNFFKEKENFDKEEKDLVQRSLLALKLNLIKLNNNK